LVRFAFKQLQAAKAKLHEAEFQFDVAIANRRAAEKEVSEAAQAFADVTNELFDQTQAGMREAA
jgi:hypothetical protein